MTNVVLEKLAGGQVVQTRSDETVPAVDKKVPNAQVLRGWHVGLLNELEKLLQMKNEEIRGNKETKSDYFPLINNAIKPSGNAARADAI
jgi:hypothetical protein